MKCREQRNGMQLPILMSRFTSWTDRVSEVRTIPERLKGD